MFNMIKKLINKLHIKRRVDLVYVPYGQAERYLSKGYTVAPEEDHNKDLSNVWLELRI